MNAQITATLAKKNTNQTTYTPLDQVRREFGFDAS